MADRPNILVFLTDDHGQWASNCYGCSELISPNMDFIAHSGARMTRAFTPCPVCSPARGSFWTGRIPSSHGIHDHIAEQDIGEKHPGLKGQTNLAMRLRAAGYRTGLSGKWHCGQAWEHQPGFDFWQALKTTQARYGEQIYFRDGKRLERFGHQAPMTTDAALEFLRQPSGDMPFFLFVGYTDTHAPFSGEPGRLVEHYIRNPLRGVADEPYSDCHGDVSYPAADARPGHPLAEYAAAVTQIDEQIGRLLDELESQGELDNTLIVYTADHGHNNGQHGLWLKGNGTTPVNFLDGSILVPCMLRWPGKIKPGQICAHFVDHCDLHMTILEAAGVNLNEDEKADTHAASYLSQLTGEQPKAWRNLQFCEYGNSRMVRSETGKLIRRYPGPNGHFRDEYYDLTIDPRETKNLIEGEESQSQIRTLSKKLDAFFAEFEDDQRSGLRVAEGPRLNGSEPWRRPFSTKAKALLR